MNEFLFERSNVMKMRNGFVIGALVRACQRYGAGGLLEVGMDVNITRL